MGLAQNTAEEISTISGGKDQTLVLLKSQAILGWGGTGSGRITALNEDICGNKTPNTGAVSVGQPARYSQISAGCGISLGVSQQQPYIWGFCQIGIGGKECFTEVPSPISELTKISKVAAGQLIFAAIDENARVYTWGLNVDSALGRTTTQINVPPDLIPNLPPIKDIVIGDHFMLALSNDHRVYGWGSNAAGQLGVGHLQTVLSPIPLECSVKLHQLTVGSTHALAISSQGEVYGWGSNHFGQSGDHRLSYISKPKRIVLPEPMTAVAAGMHYSLALSASGKVYAWGWNGCGQLGMGDLQSRTSPTVIPRLSGVRKIAAGEMHALAIGKYQFGKQQLLGWGSNASGQLGAAATKQTTPNPMFTIT